MNYKNAEEQRLAVADNYKNWKRWGPYLAERQWGTVREDYSPQGHAWSFVGHDKARSNAYRWGEEGIGGALGSMLGIARWQKPGRNSRDSVRALCALCGCSTEQSLVFCP